MGIDIILSTVSAVTALSISSLLSRLRSLMLFHELLCPAEYSKCCPCLSATRIFVRAIQYRLKLDDVAREGHE